MGACLLVIGIHPTFHYILQLLPDVPADSLASRLTVTVIAVFFLFLVVFVPRTRGYSEFFSFVVVTALLVSVAQLVVDSQNHFIYIAAGLLAIFGSTLPYTRIVTTVASYAIAFIFLIIYNAFQRRISVADFVAIVIYFTGFLISAAMSYIRIQSLLRLQLEQRRNYEAVLVEQRNQIARDVHDSIGSDLANLIVQTSAAESEEARQLNLLARRTFEKIKDVVSFLQEDDTGKESILTFIQEFVDRLNLTARFHAELRVSGSLSLTSGRSTVHLRRIFSEWMSNALRHSKATQFDIVIKSRRDYVAMTIRDNGLGFRWNGYSRFSGLGNISERVKFLHGRAFSRIWRRAGLRGTFFCLIFPLEQKPGVEA